MNLHRIVRGVINAVNPDEALILYQAVGQVNVKGVITPKYQLKDAKGNVQPLDSKVLQHLERIGDIKATMQVYLYSETEIPVSAGSRTPLIRGGDIIKRSDDTYWLVTSVIEDWTWDGWARAGITQQIKPPDLSASEVTT